MANNRWFWDSNFADWLETKTFNLAYWIADHRYRSPNVEDNTAFWTTVTSKDTNPNNVVMVEEELVEKKLPLKKATKKPTKKSTKKLPRWNY